ncbi:MAG TPA: STAS domain-containing protein [Nitrospirae bacterium]|nr:STAS domain-containing protein [Nitrospirota bacterium]
MSGTITFEQELTINRIAEVLNKLSDALTKWDEVTVDIRGVKKIDVACTQVLVAAQKESDNRGNRLILMKSDEVSSFLSRIGVQL